MTQQDYDKATGILSSIGRLRSSRKHHTDNPRITAAFDEQIFELEEEFANIGTNSGQSNLIDFHNKVRELVGFPYTSVIHSIGFEGKETFSAWNGKNWFNGTSQQEALYKICVSQDSANDELNQVYQTSDESHDSTTDSPQDTLPF